MIELKGKYTTAKIFAETIEEGVYQQVYDIINCPAFEGQSVVCMPDVHVGKSGPCGLVATIGNYICPEHIGVDIGCTVSMMILDRKVSPELYAELEHKIKTKIPFGFNINDKVIIDEKDFRKFLTKGFNHYSQRWPEMLSGLPDQVTEKWISERLEKLKMDEGVFYKSLGSVGRGNHFIEYDEQEDGDIAGITCHFGSRNFGTRVCSYWMKKTTQPLSKNEMKEKTEEFKKKYQASGKSMKEYRKALDEFIDRIRSKHINGYLSGENMKDYLMDMCFCQLYAQYNHITVQNVIKDILQKYGIKEVKTITSTHNFVDLDDHCLRKSAIRAYEGEEILVPFNMKDGVAICEGLSNKEIASKLFISEGTAQVEKCHALRQKKIYLWKNLKSP